MIFRSPLCKKDKRGNGWRLMQQATIFTSLKKRVIHSLCKIKLSCENRCCEKKNHFGKKSSLSKVRHEVEVLCCVCSIHEIVCRSNVLVKHVPLYSGKRRIKYCNLLSNYGTWIVIEFKFWPEAGKKKYVDFKTRSILLVLLYEYES